MGYHQSGKSIELLQHSLAMPLFRKIAVFLARGIIVPSERDTFHIGEYVVTAPELSQIPANSALQREIEKLAGRHC